MYSCFCMESAEDIHLAKGEQWEGVLDAKRRLVVNECEDLKGLQGRRRHGRRAGRKRHGRGRSVSCFCNVGC